MGIRKGTLANFDCINWQFKQHPSSWAFKAKLGFIVHLERVISKWYFYLEQFVVSVGKPVPNLRKKAQAVHTGYQRIYFYGQLTIDSVFSPHTVSHKSLLTCPVSYLWSSPSFISLYLSASWFFLAVKILFLEITLIILNRTNLSTVCFQLFAGINA